VTDQPMISVRSVLRGRALRASPQDQQWREARHADIRDYFEGAASLSQLRQAIGGYTGFRLVSMTDPATEEWSLLMSALDLLLEEAGVRMTPLGMLTPSEYAEMIAPPRTERQGSKHGW
jgi:hypothetical protein